MTRGQITIFFMIGLVLVIVVLLLVYVSTLVKTEEATPDSTSESSQFITNCVKEELYNNLDALGEGNFGILHSSGITYGLDGTGSKKHFSEFTAPPISGMSLVYGIIKDSTNPSTFFGRNMLPRPCDRFGPNNLSHNVPTHCDFLGTFAASPNQGPSLQEILSENITKAVNKCIQENVDEALGVDFSTYGRATTQVIYGTQAITTRTNFSDNSLVLEQNFRVRLFNLYNYAYEQLIFSTSNPEKYIGSTPGNDYRVDFIITRVPSGTNFIYTFNDTSDSFTYDNKALTIKFLVDGRGDYTDWTPPSDPPEIYVLDKFP